MVDNSSERILSSRMPPRPKKVRHTFSASLMQELLDRVQALARSERRNLSNMVAVLMEEALAARAAKKDIR